MKNKKKTKKLGSVVVWQLNPAFFLCRYTSLYVLVCIYVQFYICACLNGNSPFFCFEIWKPLIAKWNESMDSFNADWLNITARKAIVCDVCSPEWTKKNARTPFPRFTSLSFRYTVTENDRICVRHLIKSNIIVSHLFERVSDWFCLFFRMNVSEACTDRFSVSFRYLCICEFGENRCIGAAILFNRRTCLATQKEQKYTAKNDFFFSLRKRKNIDQSN